MSDTNIDERIEEILEELQNNSATDDMSHDWDADRTEAKAQIKQLIADERKKHELQARIDELENLEEDSWGVQHVPKPRKYQNGYTVGVCSIEERIATLKQELAALQGEVE